MSINRYAPLVAGCLVLAAGGMAQADCAEDLAALQQESGGISKDGSLAPLQSEGGAGAVVTTETAGEERGEAAGEVAKDGTEAPLEGEGEGDSNVAISGQAAQAQQDAATDEAAGGPRADALARAEQALAAGDEDACLQAVEEARGL